MLNQRRGNNVRLCFCFSSRRGGPSLSSSSVSISVQWRRPGSLLGTGQSGLGLLGQKMLKRDSTPHLRTTGPRKYASVAFCLLSASHAVVGRGLNVGQERRRVGGGKVEARR